MARYSEWAPIERPVQAGNVDGEFVNSEFIQIAAGPPRLSNIGRAAFFGFNPSLGAIDSLVFPIGSVQNFGLQMNRDFTRVFEIGSQRSFYISGRTNNQIQLGRVLYHGPSLLRTTMAYYQDILGTTQIPSLLGSGNAGALFVANPHDVKEPPGYKNFFLNLASDLFSQQCGLMMTIKNSNERTYGAVYAEACVHPSISMGFDAQSVVVQEQVGLQFERLVPVAIASIDLIGIDADDLQSIAPV